MKVYASVDRIEGEWLVCEVELVDVETSKTMSFMEKETEMCDVPLEFTNTVGVVAEGDILVVEYEDGEVIEICEKNNEEKNRRIALLKAM